MLNANKSVFLCILWNENYLLLEQPKLVIQAQM